MAWLTVIGPAAAQVDYRLEASAGCGVDHDREHGQEHEHAAGPDARVDYRMATDRLTWFGGDLGEFKVEAGTALVSEADKDAARALMDGCDPRTGQQLVVPKRAAHPRSRLTAAPYLEALDKCAADRGVAVVELARTKWGRARIARLARMVAREGEGHRVSVKDLEGLAAETGVALEQVYGPGALTVARAHRR
ncbi:hypothetical protein ACSNOI_06185 [Actinomadura kijaniata]|uniref:hypothetical protein n=1 Tax=Actinomadura kijaniata TaxID=46161 RepID=UPI003F1E26AF